MQVQQLPVYQFLEGSGKSFIIPVYQRDYAWTRINCQKLWDDMLDLKNNTRSDHFLGTLVTIGSGFQEYTVIDGQQRLTTISIMLIALHTFINNKSEKTKDEEILSEQCLDFLINKYSTDQDKRIRLKPNKQDKEYFENLFANSVPEKKDSNIVSNFDFFYRNIKSEILSPMDVFDAFRRLKIVLIDLVREQDDPQLIFESLNSTGVDLTAGDLIRNYILMDLAPNDQERMYKNFWIKIEKFTGNVAEFIRNYLIFKTEKSVKKDDVYTVFKKFSNDKFKRNKEFILKDLLHYAEIYSWFVQSNSHSDNDVNKRLIRLNKLEFTVAHPFLLDVFNDFSQQSIISETVLKILEIIESYAFRKIIVDNSTQGLNKMFISLSKEIKKGNNWKKEYVDILSLILLEKRVSQRFPTDEEFENSIINKEIYRLQSKNRNFLLESLENHETAYPINIDDLTIEHIMPQKITKDWKNKLGKDWQEIHRKYLHTLGNLSLTAKNTELSNNNFEKKKKIDYQVSKLKMNFLLNINKFWNEETIVERAKDLFLTAKEIWPYPTTMIVKNIPEEQLFDLSSEDSFSGSKPSRLFIEDDENGIELRSWRDLLVQVSKYLYEFSPTQFNELQNNREFNYYFNKERPMRYPMEFLPEQFIEGNMSANGAISLLAKLCERLNYPPEKISFLIQDI